MKPEPIFRTIFAFLVVAGSILFLFGAREISIANNSIANNLKQTNICETEPDPPFEQSITEFIFFESVTKYLVISLIK